MERKVRHISELPSGISDILYNHRLASDLFTKKVDYIRLFRFVSLNDEVAYAADGEQRRKTLWLTKRNRHSATAIPDALFMNGLLVKNRYGYAAY